jgi:hypothetical protein
MIFAGRDSAPHPGREISRLEPNSATHRRDSACRKPPIENGVVRDQNTARNKPPDDRCDNGRNWAHPTRILLMMP